MAPVSKSNSRRVTGSGHVIKSAKALGFTDAAVAIIKASADHSPFDADDEIRMTCYVQYGSWRNDLDCELVCDVLQKAGIVPNDRQIRRKTLIAVDPPDPNNEFTSISLWSQSKLKRAKRRRGLAVEGVGNAT
jgi:Holliday junction resolvase RusA-like endonuclease